MTENQQPDPQSSQPSGYPPPPNYASPDQGGHWGNPPYPPPPPTGYYQPYPPPYVQKPPVSGVAITSLIFGLVSIFFWWAVAPPLVALITGIYGMKEARAGKRGGGMAAIGAIIGGIGTLIWGGFLISEGLDKIR